MELYFFVGVFVPERLEEGDREREGKGIGLRVSPRNTLQESKLVRFKEVFFTSTEPGGGILE